MSIKKSEVNVGEAFGDFSKLIDTNFVPSYAIVESESAKILWLDREHVIALAKKLAISAKFDGLIKFITSVIPSFSRMSSLAKDRMGRCFKERHYLPGMVIIPEGSPWNRLHLVMNGSALLKSSKSPIEYDITNRGEFLINHENRVMTKKGYISDTVNTFQIGVVSEKQWIGEESLVNHIDFSKMSKSVKDPTKEMKIFNFPYSAVAVSNVSTLEIMTTDFKSKLPYDYIEKFRYIAIDKYQYLIGRMKSVAKSSKEIYKCVEKQRLYNEAFLKNKRKLPNASKNMLMNMQK